MNETIDVDGKSVPLDIIQKCALLIAKGNTGVVTMRWRSFFLIYGLLIISVWGMIAITYQQLFEALLIPVLFTISVAVHEALHIAPLRHFGYKLKLIPKWYGILVEDSHFSDKNWSQLSLHDKLRYAVTILTPYPAMFALAAILISTPSALMQAYGWSFLIFNIVNLPLEFVVR